MGGFHGQPHQAAAKLEGQGHNFSKQMHRSDVDEKWQKRRDVSSTLAGGDAGLLTKRRKQ